MPQEPKKRHSKQRQGKRRAHIRYVLADYVLCAQCKKPILPHTVCKYCGWYGGRQIILKKEKVQQESQNEEKRRPKT